MKPEDVLAIAQQGNPKVIAAIINRTTEPHGIFVRIARRGSCLYVLLEGDVTDRQDVLVSFMQTSLQKLQLRPIKSAIIYGRQKGQIAMVWSEQIKVVPAVVPSGPQSQAIPPFNPNPSPQRSTPLVAKPTLSQPDHPQTKTSSEASYNNTLSQSENNPLLDTLATETEESLPGTQLEEDAIAEVNAIDLASLKEQNTQRDKGKHPSIKTSIQVQPSIKSPQRQEEISKVEISQEQRKSSKNINIAKAKPSLLDTPRTPSVRKTVLPDTPALDVVDLLQKTQNRSTRPVSVETGNNHQSAGTTTTVTTANDAEVDIGPDLSTVGLPNDIQSVVVELNRTAEIVEEGSQLNRSELLIIPTRSDIDKQKLPSTQQGHVEDNNQSKDVIPSDEGQIETLSLSLLSSNQDEFEQEEIQVGKSQQTMGTLEMSTPNNNETQLDNAESAEVTDQPPAIHYAAESITAKFNTLVGPSTEIQEPDNPINEKPEQETQNDLSEPDQSVPPLPPEPEESEIETVSTTPTSEMKPLVDDDSIAAMSEELSDSYVHQPEESSSADTSESASTDASETVLQTDEAKQDIPAVAIDSASASEPALGEPLVLPTKTPTSVETNNALAEHSLSSLQNGDVETSDELEALDIPQNEEADTSEELGTLETPQHNNAEMRQEREALEATQSDNDETSDAAKQENIENPDPNSGPDLDNIDLDAFIRCPEALVLIFFTIAFFIWQTYRSILDEAAPEGMLTGSKLAKRLGVNPSTISRRKEKDGFEEWAQSIDPDGLAWSYTEGFFVPQMME